MPPAPLPLPWRRPFLIGVVHLAPTPGAPLHGRPGGGVAALLEAAERDARALAGGGVDALLVENFGDHPLHPGTVPAETVAAMALAVDRVRTVAGRLPLGVNVLRNDARSALGLCAATGAGFLRVNVHGGAMVTDQGLLQGRAAETLRERERLAPETRILADVQVKHAAPLGAISLAVSARDLTARALADALIVSGDGTGSPPRAEDVAEVKEAVGPLPVVVGSGLHPGNARELLARADGAIVGTALKQDGRIDRPVDGARVAELARLFAGTA